MAVPLGGLHHAVPKNLADRVKVHAQPKHERCAAVSQVVKIHMGQLMTAAERTEYQAKMRTLKTDKERDDFRLEHHNKMTLRAT